MGEEISKVCMCVKNSSASPENKRLSEYYSPNIPNKEKENIIKAELKRIKKNRKLNQRGKAPKKRRRKSDVDVQVFNKNAIHQSSGSSNNSTVNNYPSPSFMKDFFAEEKINSDANMSLNTESLKSYSINATNFGQLYGNLQLKHHRLNISEDNIICNENEGERDNFPVYTEHNAASSPVIYISPRAIVSVMDGTMYSSSFGKIEEYEVPSTHPLTMPSLPSDSDVYSGYCANIEETESEINTSDADGSMNLVPGVGRYI